MTKRHAQLQRWATQQLQNLHPNEAAIESQLKASWQAVAGDASFRQYFRIEVTKTQYILMDSPPEVASAQQFVQIDKQMQAAKIRVPTVYAADFERGFLIIEDFGNEMLKARLDVESGQQLFDRIAPLLQSMSQCPAEGLPEYSRQKLDTELNLFVDWYLPKHKAVKLSSAELSCWQRLCKLLLDTVLEQPKTFVHRDFHSCNLHILADNSIGVIDFQDAVFGPVSYDLISWLWDRYKTWPRRDIEQWMLQAREILAPQISQSQWIRYCDFMGLQRNLKIIGIFSRLYYRDKRQGYIEMIPQFSAYVLDVMQRYQELNQYYEMVSDWLREN